MFKKTIAYDCIFILLVSLICHLLFSPFGFNPTDEGFVLSATNRVLHGQIPHVDFSSVRPLGYAYLHIPELLISKNYFFLISRFVFWLEQTLIAFLWIRFMLKLSRIAVSNFNKYALIIVVFIYNVHYFPISVLHTIDGLLMIIVGLNLLLSEKKWNIIGFFFIGFAALCKQNYILLLPLTVILFQKENRIKFLLVGSTSILIYIVFIVSKNGWNDLIIQLSGHSEILEVGVLTYLASYTLYIGILMVLLMNKLKLNTTIFHLGLLVVLSILLVSNHYHGKWSLLLFGVLLAELFFTKESNKNFKKIILLTLIIAWSVSISVGYNTTALFSGGMLSILLLLNSTELLLPFKKIKNLMLVLLVGVFIFTRYTKIYRDANCTELTYKLDGLVEGASGIKTNLNTFKVLVELDILKKQYPGLVVLPDFTACNILHTNVSLIATEWPNKTEIPNEKILQKITTHTFDDSTTVFAITKYQTALLKDGLTELPNHGMDYRIIQEVKKKCRKINEKNYFEIYQNTKIN